MNKTADSSSSFDRLIGVENGSFTTKYFIKESNWFEGDEAITVWRALSATNFKRAVIFANPGPITWWRDPAICALIGRSVMWLLSWLQWPLRCQTGAVPPSQFKLRPLDNRWRCWRGCPGSSIFFGPAICWSVYIKQVALLLAKHRSARRWRYLFICKWSASERKRRPTFSMNFRGLSIVIKVAALWAVTATIFVNVTQSFNFDTGQVLIKLAGNAGA